MVTNILEQYGDEAGETRELGYDALGRMTWEKLGTYDVRYQYDKLGNRLAQTSPAGLFFFYNTRNELLQQHLEEGTQTLFYDLNGSLTQKVVGAVSVNYDWDSRGRLKGVKTNGVEVFRAEYAEGLNRLRKTEGSSSKVYRHDGATAIQEVDESGRMKELVRGDRGSSTVGGILYSTGEEGTNTYTYSGVGSTVLLGKDDGTARSVKYDAFGSILEADEGVDTERLANTKELDQSIGLYFHGARYYDATTGRYISADPARHGDNYYVYANNAPLSYVDPTGLAYSPSGEHGGAGSFASAWTFLKEMGKGLNKLMNTAMYGTSCGASCRLGEDGRSLYNSDGSPATGGPLAPTYAVLQFTGVGAAGEASRQLQEFAKGGAKNVTGGPIMMNLLGAVPAAPGGLGVLAANTASVRSGAAAVVREFGNSSYIDGTKIAKSLGLEAPKVLIPETPRTFNLSTRVAPVPYTELPGYTLFDLVNVPVGARLEELMEEILSRGDASLDMMANAGYAAQVRGAYDKGYTARFNLDMLNTKDVLRMRGPYADTATAAELRELKAIYDDLPDPYNFNARFYINVRMEPIAKDGLRMGGFHIFGDEVGPPWLWPGFRD